jgi:hypothetical protein
VVERAIDRARSRVTDAPGTRPRSPLELTIVVPLYRCDTTVGDLVARLHAALRAMPAIGGRYEVLLVDDASPDGTAAAERAVAIDPTRTRLLRLPENRGQQRAVLAGLREACGRLWAVMDGDLQDPPELLPRLVQALDDAGVDVAYAARRGGHGSAGRALSSKLFKTAMRAITGAPRDAGMYFVTRRAHLEPRLPPAGAWAWLPALLASATNAESAEWSEPTSVSVSFERPRPTEQRASAYSSLARLRLGFRALVYAVALRARPVRPIILESTAAGLLGALAGAWVLAKKPFDLGDEGFLYLLARLWAHGSNLYDAHDLIYPPGVHVVSGWTMKAFGVTLPIYRASIAAMFGVALAVLSASLRKRGVPRLTLALALAAMVGYAEVSFKVLPIALALAAALAAASRRFPGRGALLVLGSTIGFLAGFREDAAVLVGACAGIALLRRRQQLRRLRATLVDATLVGATTALAFGVWFACFAVRAGGREFLAHVAHRFEFLVRRVGEPTPIAWEWALPRGASLARWSLITTSYQTVFVIALAAVVAWSLWRRRREVPHDTGLRTAAITLTAALCFLPQFWERPDTPHLRNYLAAFLPAMAAATALWRGAPSGSLPRVRRAALVLLGVAALALAAFPWLTRHRGPVPAAYPTLAAQLQGLLLYDHPPWAGELAHTPGTLVVLWWGPGWYVIEDVAPGTKTLSTFARHQTPESTARLVADLERPGNQWVITVPGGEVPASVLAALDREYQRRATWNIWELWARRGSIRDTDRVGEP